MKSSKKVVALTLAAAMMFGNVMGVFAANTDTDWTEEDNKITFESGGGLDPTDPVNPEDPDKPADPDPNKEDPTGNTGDLRLDVVPTFDFGTQNITTGVKEYNAEVPVDRTTGDNLPYYVQVTDVRGSGAGWSLSAELTTEFTDVSGHTLDGAEIELSNLVASAQTGTTVPSSVFDRTLEYGTKVKLAAAAANEGMGTSTIRFGNTLADTSSESSVTLTIPAATTVYASEYTAEINWTLGATP